MIDNEYRCTSDVYEFNKVIHSWQAIVNVPSARRSPAVVCTADNRVIVIGGWNDNRDSL